MHSHGHHHAEGHSHGRAAGSSGVLGGAMAATLALVVVEFVAGTMGHSIALVATVYTTSPTSRRSLFPGSRFGCPNGRPRKKRPRVSSLGNFSRVRKCNSANLGCCLHSV